MLLNDAFYVFTLILVRSFLDLAQELLKEDGVTFLLSEKFSQDPVDVNIARQGRSGGSNENPNLDDFEIQEVSLSLFQCGLTSDLCGNTQNKASYKRPALDGDDFPLPSKRKRLP